jgi:hypothetical protein
MIVEYKLSYVNEFEDVKYIQASKERTCME